jgi:hypothetical protein
MAEQGGFEREFARVEALMRDWSLEEATRVLEEVRRAGGPPNRVRHDLSVLYAQQGLFAEALAEIEAALALEPGNRALWHHFLALQKNNPRQPSAVEWRAMHLAYGETLRDAVDARHLDVVRDASPGRRLRVGYLCLDTHLATERFVWPVLAHFDPAAVEVYAYWCHSALGPEQSAAYPRAVHRSLVGLDDEQVTAMIVADAIDVLVDIAGHGAGNRLPVLARRPAPVVATWLDYLATTGLDTVDYRITDAAADPEGAEAAHVERLIRLPVPQWCYRPPAAAAAAAPSAGGPPTFGSVSVPLKLSETLLDLWARLLARVPGSRLRLLGVPEGRARERILGHLGRGGVEASRVEILPRLAQADFLRSLAELDVVLDTHPFSGATSTLDALWQGVPVVTLAGALAHSRSTASILQALGRADWVATTAEDYVRIASGLAGQARDPGRRSRLRADLQSSPLCDGPGFARAMEAACRRGWGEGAWRAERRPRDVMAQFWRELRAHVPVARERVALAGIADVVDFANADAAERLASARREWVLLTDSSLFRGEVAAASIPATLLDRHDVLAPLGTAELGCGEPVAAGEGRVRGVALVDDAQVGKLFASAFVPRGGWPCVALSGGAMLVRRSRLDDPGREMRRASHPIDFRCTVVRLSHRLHLAGARLGVCVALAPADRVWTLDDAHRHAALRALEGDLGLPRWGKREASARPMKAALSAALWEAVRPALEELCDS